jgi:anaerobic magnesium-protoporphyrin IX monomethyl ester cyclase
LDKIKFPTYDKFPLERYVTEEIGIVSSRGCPYNCIYCPVRAAIGKHWRKRKPESIVQEIKYWYDMGYRQFSILDDNFTLEKKRVLEICRKICDYNFDNIELNCNNGIRADNVDREILQAMKNAGFKYLAFGVEAGNNKVLKSIGKGESLEVIKEAIRIALDLDYKVTLFFLAGSPIEAVQDVNDSIKLATQYPMFDARFYNVIPFPKSRLYDWVTQQDCFLVNHENYLNNCSQWDSVPVFETSDMTREERIKMLKKTRNVRKIVRFNSMKSALKFKFGFFAVPIAKIYISDFFQNLLMKNRFLRRNLKQIFQKVTNV